MSFDKEVGGPCADERQCVYAHMGMTNNAIHHVENMVYASPSRKVGKAALTNVITRLDSIKNGSSRILESHTCELVCAYEMEIDTDVIGYYAQVPCVGIERCSQAGRRHVTSANLDFLVFRKNSVELVECKPRSWLLKENARPDSEWVERDGAWHHDPYETFAKKQGISLSIWSPPNEPGIYLQTLEAIYAVMRGGINSIEEKAIAQAVSRIAIRPTTLRELCADIEGFDIRAALWMLGKSIAHGPWISTPILLIDQFVLYSDREQAQIVDTLALKKMADLLSQSLLSDSLLLARTTDVEKARSRLARVEAIVRGGAPATVRMRHIERRVKKAIESGEPPLSACLTKYGNSGNRLRRLSPDQLDAMEYVIARQWNTGKIQGIKRLHFAYQQRCRELGFEPAGKTALRRRLRQENPSRHAIATGGLRGFQAIRPASDPRRRSQPPIGYGHTLHIDSSDLDNRIAPDILKLMPASKAKFYIGVDGATGEPMAHALIFGSARTDGVAILIREYVRRHKHLPNLIHVDRGPENRSWWIEELAEGYSSLRWSPTAGSAWNGIAENAIKQVNTQVAHQLIGSTWPDQLGRKVDGRFKSHRNAKTSFEVVLSEFLAFVYQDHPNTPAGDGMTPLEKRDRAIEVLGHFGVACDLNEDLLLRTSIRVDAKKSVSPERGVRTEEGYFTSDELIRALRFNKPEELRSDCEDPTLLRVRIGASWLKAFHTRVLSMALLPLQEKLFELMYGPERRAIARERGDNIARIRYGRIQLANFATLASTTCAVKELGAGINQPNGNDNVVNDGVDPSIDSRRSLWDNLEPCIETGAGS